MEKVTNFYYEGTKEEHVHFMTVNDNYQMTHVLLESFATVLLHDSSNILHTYDSISWACTRFVIKDK